MRRFLVVANRTLGGDHLLEKIRECLGAGPCAFHVVVPVELPTDHLWTEGEIREAAQARLDRALERFREVGAQVEGEVGDSNPMIAIGDALRESEFDEIILSTLPPGPSRWLKLDLPHRVASRFPVQVTHVVGTSEPESG